MSDVVFNKQAFYSHLGGDSELGNEILSVYIVDAPARLKGLKSAFADEEGDMIIKYAHALKGISATIRAESTASVSEQIELSARSGDLETVRKLMPQLDSELEKVLKVIGELFNS